MKKSPDPAALETVKARVLADTTIVPEGFSVDLTKAPNAWSDLSRSLGGRALCRAAADVLCAAYRDTYGREFLFSEACVAFELKYHLDAYLYTQGLRRLRHVTTLLFSKARLARSCRTVEIDVRDAYLWKQRLMFRYFFGVRKALRRTPRDPYALRFGDRLMRVPFGKKKRGS